MTRAHDPRLFEPDLTRGPHLAADESGRLEHTRVKVQLWLWLQYAIPEVLDLYYLTSSMSTDDSDDLSSKCLDTDRQPPGMLDLRRQMKRKGHKEFWTTQKMKTLFNTH